jgi:lipopolysaccharide biosynthesis regulator YciM
VTPVRGHTAARSSVPAPNEARVRKSIGVFLLGSFAAVIALTHALSAARGREVTQRRVATSAAAVKPDEAQVRDLDIAFFARRASEDPWSAADRARLGALYLQRARETGNFNDYRRAESLAVKALRLREAHNDETFTILASARLAQHDFTGALAAARTLVARNPDEPRDQALLGEVLLELGRYAQADTIFRSLESQTDRLSVASRLMRWYELTGRMAQTKQIARYSLRRAADAGATTREQLAWFHLRLGELELKSGEVERAESLFVAGLAAFPRDYRLLGALSRAAAMRDDWTAAIDAGNRAIAIQLDPATLGVLADAYDALGDTAQSRSYQRAMRASALTQPGTIHRAWGLFLLDHGLEARDVLVRARRELRTRRDVYGYDLTAWALHALRRDHEASALMDSALAQATDDAQLWYHAAVIARANGDDARATQLLDRARALNPRYRGFQAARASPEASRVAVSVGTAR